MRIRFGICGVILDSSWIAFDFAEFGFDRACLLTAQGAEKATPEDVMEACKGILQNSAQILFAGNQKELSEGAEETVGKVETLLQLAKPMALQGTHCDRRINTTDLVFLHCELILVFAHVQAPEERVGSSFTDSVSKTIDEMVRLLQVASKVNKADPATQTKLEGTDWISFVFAVLTFRPR